LKAENRTKAMDSEYVMVGDGVLAILSFSNLFKVILRYYNLLKLIGGDFETVMKKNENSHEKKI
jgi:cGMP-dependent protein kinase